MRYLCPLRDDIFGYVAFRLTTMFYESGAVYASRETDGKTDANPNRKKAFGIFVFFGKHAKGAQ